MKRLLLKILLPLIAILILLSGCYSQKKEGKVPTQVYEETKVEIAAETTTAETTTAETTTAETTAAETTVAETIAVETTVAETDESETETDTESGQAKPPTGVVEDGYYTSKEEVAEYIHKFGKLPGNFVSKSKAKKLGWGQEGVNLQEVLPQMSIGGGKFGNREGLLPEAPGREYRECDIDYEGGPRNAKRIVYSNDGLIFYTEDHYESFEQLY